MKARTYVAFILALAVGTACEGLGIVEADLLPGFSDGILKDVGFGAVTTDNYGEFSEVAGDFGGPAEVLFEVEGDAPFAECEPGAGCFGDNCSNNGECQSGWCVDHMGEGTCTQACQAECPPGWSCQQVAGTEPDVIYICVSEFANLCRPCAGANDCHSTGGAEDACISYGSEGSFCGGTCEDDEECPWGFSCQTAQTVDGITTTQCVAEAGVCPCTAKSIMLSLWTPCELANDSGTCAGKRVCAAGGLTPCDALEPQGEACNGIDDDCDGETDEPAMIGGEYVNLCGDDNSCTTDLCAGLAGCEHTPLTDVECIDGDSCTVGDHCEAGICVGSPVQCDDSNPCTDDSCDGFGGCSFVINMSDCDDGDPCTVGDQCEDGVCLGVVVPCDCQEDADCGTLEDGDLCNGSLFCDQEEWPYKCKVAEETVVVCPLPPDGPGAFCLEAVCEPATGECTLAPLHEGLPCDDGDKCTSGDLCATGLCQPGPPTQCADDNVCTDDSCEPTLGCVHVDNAQACQDGNSCTVSDQCSKGVCVPGELQDCDDGNPCTDDVCDPALGCVHPGNAEPCDDGNACTVGDHCAGGKCAIDEVADCDDGNLCTTDSCDAALGCVNAANSAPCDDFDACTLGDVCAGGACVSGAPANCDDGNVCTDDECQPLAGCLHLDNTDPCDDFNDCTVGDLCKQGECVGTGSLECDDGNPCTKDLCLPGGGCQHEVVDVPCSDGDPCTLSDQCLDGLCLPGEAKNCDDVNPCTDDSCNESGQCENMPNQAECTDGNECTLADHCEAGQCVNSGLSKCNDDDVCTDDFCDPLQGCVHLLNSAPCDDGDLCTTKDQCQLGNCVGGASLVCVDGNPCTDDSCNPDAGCEFVANQDMCDDGNLCTVTDQCLDGVCKGSGVPDCDDGNLCTTDWCDPVQGCVNTHNTNPCNDGDPCTVLDTCADGLCGSGLPFVCDDGNPCTDDTCAEGIGCQFDANTAPCEDGDACTVDDTCADLACVSGLPADCDDQDVCTDDSCESDTGCVYVHNNSGCDDDDDGTVTDLCVDGECVGSGAPDCDDGSQCTSDSCEADQGCIHTDIVPCCGNGQQEAGEECDDGNIVDGDGCSSDCQQVTYLAGSFVVSNGPAWGSNPPCYTCREACALLLGGSQSQYRCSTVNSSINYKAWLDGWGDSGTYCGGTPGADDYKKSVNYNCGGGACSYSAYVSDHGCGKTNYCWDY